MSERREYLNIGEAADALGVTRKRIWRMIHGGEVAYTENPVDRREKLIARSEIDRLMAFSKKGVA